MSAPGELFRPLFNEEVVVVEGDPRRTFPEGTLFSEEEALIDRAVAVRRQEFTAGRAFARRGMRSLGFAAAPILADRHRAPQWPAGVVGTISHTRRWCVAAVGRASSFRAIGADVEDDRPLEEALWRLVCSPAELGDLRGLGDVGCWAKLVFSAKESAYKAQYPISGAFFGLKGMTVRVVPDQDTNEGRFVAELTQARPPFSLGARFEGRYRRHHGMWATAVELPVGAPLAPTPS